jgi:hypothetical protein
MENLEGEVEARYAWATAALVAQRERRARIAAQVRPIVMRSAPSPYKHPRTGRERFEEFLPAVPGRITQYPPGWTPHSALALRDALAAGWKPGHSVHSAFSLYMGPQAAY